MPRLLTLTRVWVKSPVAPPSLHRLPPAPAPVEGLFILGMYSQVYWFSWGHYLGVLGTGEYSSSINSPWRDIGHRSLSAFLSLAANKQQQLDGLFRARLPPVWSPAPGGRVFVFCSKEAVCISEKRQTPYPATLSMYGALSWNLRRVV